MFDVRWRHGIWWSFDAIPNGQSHTCLVNGTKLLSEILYGFKGSGTITMCEVDWSRHAHKSVTEYPCSHLVRSNWMTWLRCGGDVVVAMWWWCGSDVVVMCWADERLTGALWELCTWLQIYLCLETEWRLTNSTNNGRFLHGFDFCLDGVRPIWSRLL